MAQNPQNLQVYEESMQFACDCYRLLDHIQGSFRLKEQLFGSTTSVPANLAEFCALENKGSQIEKLNRCIAETNETDMWLDFCKRQNLIEQDLQKKLINRNKVIRMKLMQLKRAVQG